MVQSQSKRKVYLRIEAPLRQSGLDKSIKQFLNKPDFVLSGFSAGALVLTPNIKICNLPGFDENMIELKNPEATLSVRLRTKII